MDDRTTRRCALPPTVHEPVYWLIGRPARVDQPLMVRVTVVLTLLLAGLLAPQAHAAPSYFLDFYANGQIHGSHPGGVNGYLTLERGGQQLAASEPVADGNSYTKLLGQQPAAGDVVRYVIGGQTVVTYTFDGMPRVTAPCAGDTVVRGEVTASPRNVFVHSLPVSGPGPSSTVVVDGTAMTATFARPLPLGRVEVSLFSQTAEAYIWSQGLVNVRDCAAHGSVTSATDLVVAGGTQANDMTVSVDTATGRYRVLDVTGELKASAGCTSETAHSVTCDAPPSGRVVVQAGGADDSVTLDPSVPAAGSGRHALAGGDGADELTGTDADEALDGGAGADTLTAAGGDDSLAGGSGGDTLDGGAGDDTLDARDGAADTVDCGTGDADELDRDAVDVNVACETVRTVVAPGVSPTPTAPVPAAPEPAAPMPVAPVSDPAPVATPTGFASPRANVSLSVPAAGAAVRRGVVRLTLANDNPFPVRATAVLRLAGGRARRAARLGTVSGSLAPGARVGLSVRLTTRGRALLKRRRTVVATLATTLRDPQGGVRTVTRRVRIRAGRGA